MCSCDGICVAFTGAPLTPSIAAAATDRACTSSRPDEFGSSRSLTATGIRCKVVAPSNLQRPSQRGPGQERR